MSAAIDPDDVGSQYLVGKKMVPGRSKLCTLRNRRFNRMVSAELAPVRCVPTVASDCRLIAGVETDQSRRNVGAVTKAEEAPGFVRYSAPGKSLYNAGVDYG